VTDSNGLQITDSTQRLKDSKSQRVKDTKEKMRKDKSRRLAPVAGTLLSPGGSVWSEISAAVLGNRRRGQIRLRFFAPARAKIVFDGEVVEDARDDKIDHVADTLRLAVKTGAGGEHRDAEL